MPEEGEGIINRVIGQEDDVWKVMFGDEVIAKSDLQYAVGATMHCRYQNGSREFRVVSVDKTTKICKALEVKK